MRDNGVWIAALKRAERRAGHRADRGDHARAASCTKDGVEHEVDVIIYGTGFTASDFLKTYKVIGRGGRRAARPLGRRRARLSRHDRAGFPNLFMIYGPNTNIVVNGSIIFFSECSVRYIVGCLKLMAETGAATLEVRKDVHDAFNVKVDEANAQDGLGRAAGDQLVQERQGPRQPELALPAGRLLDRRR